MTRGVIIAVLASVALAAAAHGVRAQDASMIVVAQNDFATPAYGGTPMAPRTSLEWDAAKGRWGLNLGVEQHAADQDVQLKDVSPGVYYRLTKRLHIGGAVSLAPDQAQTQRLGEPQMPSPRVRLETTFKF